jgi:hypothetical protein
MVKAISAERITRLLGIYLSNVDLGGIDNRLLDWVFQHPKEAGRQFSLFLQFQQSRLPAVQAELTKSAKASPQCKPLAPISNECPGKEWEKRVFGISSNFHFLPPYLDYSTALEEAKLRQHELGWDEKNPKPGIARVVFDRVRKLVGCKEDQLKFYCSLNTVLDFHHGIDGFLTLDVDGREFVVTFDLKAGKNAHKASCKADVLFLCPTRQRMNTIDGAAQEIAAQFDAQILDQYQTSKQMEAAPILSMILAQQAA